MFRSFFRNRFTMILAAGLVFAFSACSEDEDLFKGTGAFTATIGNSSYSSDALATLYNDQGVNIIKIQSIADNGQTFIIALQSDTTGTFDIDLRGASVKYITQGGEVLSADRGTVTLTEADTEVSGTFDFIVDAPENNQPLSVTGGSFEGVELTDERD